MIYTRHPIAASLISLTLGASLVMASAPAEASWKVRIGAEQILEVKADSARRGYPAERLIDGRPGRAWVSEPGAEAPSVTLTFREMSWISRVDLLAGDAGNNASFERFARPIAVELAWEGGAQRFALEDRRTLQTINLDQLVVTRWLRLTVIDWTGPSQRGVALSEITLYAPGDVSEADPGLSDRIADAVRRLGSSETLAGARAELVSYGEHAVGPLMSLLAREGAARSFEALRIIHRIGGRTAKTLVQRLLTSRSVEDRALALRLLVDKPVASLAGEVFRIGQRSANVELRTLALHIVGELGDRRLHWLVEGAFKSGAPALVAEALTWLPSLGERGRGIALELMESPRGEQRIAGIAGLGGFSYGPASRAALRRALDDAHPAVRAAALRALRDRDDASSVPSLVERVRLVESDDEAHATIRALFKMGDAARDQLLARLHDLSLGRAESVLRELGDERSPASASIIARLVDSEFGNPLFPVVTEVFDQQGPLAVTELLNLMRRDPSRLRQSEFFLIERAPLASASARRSLAEFGRDTRWLPLEAARDRDRLIVLLLEVVAAAHDAEAADAVVAIFNNPTSFDRRLRSAAVEALGALAPSEKSKQLILSLVSDAHSPYQLAALGAAASLGLREALPVVWERFKATRPRDWDADAVTTVGALGGAAELEHLFRGYAYANPSARRAILKVAYRARTPRAISLLVDAAASQDHRMRRMASALLLDD